MAVLSDCYKLPLVGTLLTVTAWCQTQQLPEKASFEGIILNAITGEPVRKVLVTLKPLPQRPTQGQRQSQQPQDVIPVSASSDAAGKFLLENVDPASYQLTARRDGFADGQHGFRTGAPGTTEPIVLAKGDHKSGFVLKMTPYGTIAGRVVDEEGDPIRNVQISAMSYRYTSRGRELHEVRTGSTNDLGEYRVFDIPAGKYFIKSAPRQTNRLSVESQDANSFTTAYYPGAPDPNGGSRLEVNAGRQVSGVDFTLRKARYATISGRVAAPPEASNVSFGLMTVTDGGSSSSSTGINGKDGKFQLVGVPPGNVYVTGSYVLNGRRHYAQVPLQVSSTDITGIELHPIAAMDVTGQVRIEGQSTVKLSQIQINLRGPGNNYGSEAGGVSGDGNLLFRGVSPNVYKVSAGGAMSDLYIKSVQWGTLDVTDGEIDLNNGLPPRTELVVVLGTDAAQIEGKVENDKPEPVPTATVMIVPASGHKSAPFFKSATTDNNGKFTIKGIAPGSYRVYAWDKVDTNAVIYDPEFLPPFDTAAKKVEVAGNEKKQQDLRLIVNPQPQ